MLCWEIQFLQIDTKELLNVPVVEIMELCLPLKGIKDIVDGEIVFVRNVHWLQSDKELWQRKLLYEGSRSAFTSSIYYLIVFVFHQ